MKHDSEPLRLAMTSLAAKNAAASPPSDLEARVLAKFDRAARRASPSGPWWWATAAAVLASLAVLLLVPGAEIRQQDQLFVQIPYTVPPAPYERLKVVRQNVPIAALIAAGFRVHAPDAGAAVPAELIVGQDGRALAIRFVSPTMQK